MLFRVIDKIVMPLLALLMLGLLVTGQTIPVGNLLPNSSQQTQTMNTQQADSTFQPVLTGTQPLTSKTAVDLLYAGSKPTFEAGWHGLSGWEGEDWSVPCGTAIYSPLPGTGKVTYNALDGYVGPYAKDLDGNGYLDENTMITIEGDAGTVTLFHGIYTPLVGTTVIGGVTPIGYESSQGNSKVCHSHIVVRPNASYMANASPTLSRKDIVQTNRSFVHSGKPNGGNWGSVLSTYNNVDLRISHYVPADGGINCDSDCSTMASGEKVAAWLGRTNPAAASCPQEWGHNTQFVLEGALFSCQDRGGWINCYKPGDVDPALSTRDDFGNVIFPYHAESAYCWVDLLQESPYRYGTLVSNWDFVR